MKVQIEEVLDRVKQTETARSDYVSLAAQWERMWLLDAGFSQSWRDSVQKDGRELVVTPDPYNAVNLALRLIATQPKIDCPPRDKTEEATQQAQRKENFLTAMWQRSSALQGRNVLADAAWLSLVRGRVAFEVKWVKDVLPPNLAKKRFPILIRTLDPLNVGVHRGPLYTEYAFHKYRDKIVNVKQRYPKLKRWSDDQWAKDESNEVSVIDYWWVDQSSGDIWNAIIVEDEFAKKPIKTAYQFIPIIEAYGDSAPTKNEAYRGMSILHPMNGLWQYKCRLASNMGTGALWATWPFFLVSHPMGVQIDDIIVRPGATETVPDGTRVEQVMPQVNLTVIREMLGQVEAGLQQSAFPSVLYGESGSMQAGYGVSLLSDAAKGRIKSFLEYLEMAVMLVNESVLSLVESFDDDDEGVDLWGKDEKSGKLYKLCLYKNDIQGYYENLVLLRPNLPQDDMQRQTMGIRLADGKYISKQTLRDKYLPVPVPSDEQDRIWAEIAMDSPELRNNIMLAKLIEIYPKTWDRIVMGTPLEGVAKKMLGGLGIQQPQPPMLSMGGPPGGGMPMGVPGIQQPQPPMPIQPPAVTGPNGGGIPPVMQGQIEPENLGLPPGVDPILFAQMMGRPLPPAEELNILAGLPQEGK